jgi:hypothetical protein
MLGNSKPQARERENGLPLSLPVKDEEIVARTLWYSIAVDDVFDLHQLRICEDH